jgi:hypothetical protein
LAQDIRLFLRSLTREKGFTVAALLSLALGIGANTALFSIAFGVTIIAAALSGLLPALRASRADPVQALREGSGATASLTTQRLSHGRGRFKHDASRFDDSDAQLRAAE